MAAHSTLLDSFAAIGSWFHGHSGGPTRSFGSKLSAIGLDIGHTGVRAVQLKRNGSDWEVRAAVNYRSSLGSALSDPDMVEPGVHQPGQSSMDTIGRLAETLRRTLREHDFRGRRVVTGLSTPDLELHLLELPLPSHDSRVGNTKSFGDARLDAELNAAAHYEIGRLSGLAEETIETDWWPLPTGHRSAATALGAMVVAEKVERLGQLCLSAGLECSRVDAFACALARFGYGVLRPSEQTIWGILDLGGRAVRAVVCVDAVPVVVRSFDQGGELWTRRIAEGLQVTAETSELLKKDHGIVPESLSAVRGIRRAGRGESGNTGTESEIQQAFRGVALRGKDRRSPTPVPEVAAMIYTVLKSELDQMIHEIERSYSYVLQCYASRSAGPLLLTGGGAAMRNLGQLLATRLGIPVHDPGEIFKKGTQRLLTGPAEPLSDFAVAIGLALES